MNIQDIANLINLGQKITQSMIDSLSDDINKPINDDNLTLLHSAAHNSQVDNVKILLKNKANPNVKTKEGYRPMYLAINNDENDYKIVQLLIDYGADLTIKTNADTHLLDIIIADSDVKSLKVLIDNGVKLTSKDKAHSPLLFALALKNIAISSLIFYNIDFFQYEDKELLKKAIVKNIKKDKKNNLEWNKMFNIINQTKYGRRR